MTDQPFSTRIGHAAYTPGTWAGGTIRGIWADPAESIAAPARARRWVGTALIERTAPYSDFSGLTRLHLPIHGGGVKLSFGDPDEVVLLERRAQREFDGGRPVVAEPQGGPVGAFNLIYDHSVRAAAAVVDVGEEPRPWALEPPPQVRAADRLSVVRIIYVVTGAIRVNAAGGTLELGADDSFVFATGEGPDAAALPSLASALPTPAEVILAGFWSPR